MSERNNPLCDGKYLDAHYMTLNNPWNSPAMFDQTMYRANGVAANIGGAYTVLPTASFYKDRMTKEEFFRWEIEAARRSGLDGFEFFYPHNMNDLDGEMRRYDAVIKEFVSIVEDSGHDFRLSLCLSHPNGVRSLDGLVRTLGERIRALLNHTRGAGCWLRTPDGRLIVKTFAFERAVTAFGRFYGQDVESSFECINEVIRRIESTTGERFAVIWHMRPFEFLKRSATEVGDEPHQYYRRVLESACEYFAGLTGFADVLYDDSDRAHHALRETARRTGTSEVQAVFLDFFRAQLFFRDGTGSRRPHAPSTYRAYRAADFFRWYIPAGGASHVVELFRRATDEDVPMIRIITWNDYPEGHNLAPDLSHNFAFGLIVRELKQIWMGETARDSSDVVAVFTKRYDPNLVKPAEHNIQIRPPEHILPPDVWRRLLARESSMCIYTHLRDQGMLFVNGRAVRAVPAGPTLSWVTLEPGPVTARVEREQRVVAQLETEEWITDAPVRTDMNTYAFSSQFHELYRECFREWFDGNYYTERTYRQLETLRDTSLEHES